MLLEVVESSTMPVENSFSAIFKHIVENVYVEVEADSITYNFGH